MSAIFELDTSRLLNESTATSLKHKNMLRSLANADDIIWQQMSFKYFIQFVRSGQLYFKSLACYDDYDERRWNYYRDGVYTGVDEKQLREYEKKSFISCWYNDRALSDVVFKQYAASDDGIAIGTTVEALKKYFKNNSPKDSLQDNNKFFFGNVQYIKATECKNSFDCTQLIAPAYIKGQQFKADREFRVLWQHETDSQAQQAKAPVARNFPPEQTENLEITVPSFIKWIAFKSISGYAKLSTLPDEEIKKEIEKRFSYKYEVRSEYDSVGAVDGFVVLERKR